MKKISTLIVILLVTLSVSAQVRISQVYGAGGNSGATYNQDYVELFNAGATPVSLDGWSIQYASATGPGGAGNWAVDSFPNGLSIAAGKYFLVALASSATGAALPTPDHTNTFINLAGSAGKVALVSSQTPLNGATACNDANAVDIVGYGANASCSETAPASASGLTNAESFTRKNNGCVEFNDNSIDFEVLAANPRNSSNPVNVCPADPLILMSRVTGIFTTTGNASTSSSFMVHAINLTGAPGNITVTSSDPAFEISLNSAAGFGSSVTIPFTSSAALSTTLYTRISATAPLGFVTADVIASGGGAAEDTAVMNGNVLVAEPTVQATDIVTSNITDSSVTVNWTNGNGTNRIVVVRAVSSTATLPADGRGYGASADFRTAPSLGSSNNVVFNGTGDGPVTVIGLLAGITYSISVYEYDSSGSGTQNYLTTTTATNPVTITTTGLSANLTQINFTALAAPLYMGSGTATRTPTMYYARINNLLPNTTYRYYTQASVLTDIGAAAGGAGNPILFDYTVSPVTYTYTSSASLANAGGYGKFTTDASGSFKGSFGFVNTGNTRFTAGNLVRPSIVIAPDPNTTAQYRFALDQEITVLAFASSAGATNGTFIQGTSLATPGNLVGLWDNTTASGRPLAMTMAENPTFGGTTVWGTSFVPGYDITAGSWNTIIPNDNANGVRILQQFNLVTGAVQGCRSDADGTWPTGTVVTANPLGGTTPLQIASADAPLTDGNCFDVIPVRFEYINGKKINTGITVNWKLACLSTSITMELQRAADTRNFTMLTSITATQARCAEPFNYMDAVPLKGKNFYRLKMTDIDGRVSYSPVIVVVNGSTGFEIAGLYPSVVTGKAFLSVYSARATVMETVVSDISGKIITRYKQNISAGSSLLPVDCSKLAAGLYNLSGIVSGEESKTFRFIKQ